MTTINPFLTSPYAKNASKGASSNSASLNLSGGSSLLPNSPTGNSLFPNSPTGSSANQPPNLQQTMLQLLSLFSSFMGGMLSLLSNLLGNSANASNTQTTTPPSSNNATPPSFAPSGNNSTPPTQTSVESSGPSQSSGNGDNNPNQSNGQSWGGDNSWGGSNGHSWDGDNHWGSNGHSWDGNNHWGSHGHSWDGNNHWGSHNQSPTGGNNNTPAPSGNNQPPPPSNNPPPPPSNNPPPPPSNNPPPPPNNNNQPFSGFTGGQYQGNQQATGTGNNNNTWASNVNVFASSAPNQETTDWLSNNQLVGGYLSDVEKGMDNGNTLAQAAQSAKSDSQIAQQAPQTSANVNTNSLVPHGGGNAIIVTGDNYDSTNTQSAQLQQKLQQDYGMNVDVINDGSPAQLQQAIQQMGQQKGSQCLVAVLAHGAEGTQGQPNQGNIALGKGDGNQWLTEPDLKAEINQYLAPNYNNVNILLNSCYSGQYTQ